MAPGRLLLRLLMVMLALGAISVAEPVNQPASAPVLPVGSTRRIEVENGYYHLQLPPGYAHGDRPPLVICLHGTDTSARDMLEYWQLMNRPVPMILASPQARAAGWREADLEHLWLTTNHIKRTVTYDPDRVLLAGHSAGGAMSLHLLFREQFPATAVVATANYLPPSVRSEHIRDRREVPIFYAVGRDDINHERMREAIRLMRENGATITMLRPHIGHQLDRRVGQRAMDWFVDLCRQRVDEKLAEASRASRRGQLAAAAAALEVLVQQERYHLPEQVAAARRLLEDVCAEGREKLAKADQAVDERRWVEAITALREVELTYSGSRLASVASQERRRIESEPQAAVAIEAHTGVEYERRARQLYASAQRLAAAGNFDQAKRRCRDIVRCYGTSAAAARAQRLLRYLERQPDLP